jgi:hypothetical protein
MDYLCDVIRQGKPAGELRSASNPRIWTVIENPSEANIKAVGTRRSNIASYLWTMAQASILYTDGLNE